MNGEQQNTKAEFFSCCEGMDLAELTRKRMLQEAGCLGVDRAEKMQKMMTMYCRPGQEKDVTTDEV